MSSTSAMIGFFRRPRAGRACGACHARRVRCDASSHGLPCTNCAASSQDCSIPPKKKTKRSGNGKSGMKRLRRKRGSFQQHERDAGSLAGPAVSSSEEFVSLILQANERLERQPDYTGTYEKLVKGEATRSAIGDPGRVAYLEEFSNLSLLLHDYKDPSAVHYPIPKISNNSKFSTRIDDAELEILRSLGALSFPPRGLCDELVHAYFKWVAPIVPVINRDSFLKRYRDQNNPPSILLLQTILLAGSRVCSTPSLMDSNGSPIPAATLFYQRAKALYDADYEEDRVTIVQALILMGWHWEDPGKVTKDVFYWNGVATTIAQGCGMHRSTRDSKLSLVHKRLWTRIWWTLVTRDRSVAVAVGRPTHINLAHSDVEMICEDDFIDEDGWSPSPVQVQFFLQYVKLSEIMDLVLFQNYSISPQAQQHNAMALAQCDLLLAEWLQNCPTELRWDQSRYNFWSAYLNCIYHTTSCLLHRAYLPPPSKPPASAYPSRSPAFQAAHTITSITEILIDHNELKYAPPFIIYSLLSALLVHIYQLHTAIPAEAVIAQQKRILTCLDALERVSEVWLVAKMTYDIFESILESTGFGHFLRTMPEEDFRQQGLESKPKWPSKRLGRAPAVSGKITKATALTPALVAHMDAVLISVATSSKPGQLRASKVIRSPGENPSAKQVSKQGNMNGEMQEANSFTLNTDMLGKHSSAWMEYAVPSSPAPTGLNVTEWFHNFFGIQSHEKPIG